jgi:KDO2-lipid IV(A) lauroyltransferase
MPAAALPKSVTPRNVPTASVAFMTDEGAVPLRWLLERGERRQRAWQHWVSDTAVGLRNTSVHHALRLLPIDTCSDFGSSMGRYTPSRFPDSDRQARRNFRLLRPEADDPAWLDDAMRRMWDNSARTMAEFSVLHRLWDAGRVQVDGIEHALEVKRKGQPLLVAAIHLGNWELIGVIGIRNGINGAAIYSPPENRFEHRIATSVRRRFGGEPIPPSPRTMLDARRVIIEERNALVIYVDEHTRGRVQAPSFGRAIEPSVNLEYIVRLALATDAAIIPAYCLREHGTARFRGKVLPPLDLVRTGDAGADIATNVKQLNAIIEPIILANLDQWFYLPDLELPAKKPGRKNKP